MTVSRVNSRQTRIFDRIASNRVWIGMFLAFLPTNCIASTETAQVCDRAAVHAARITGVPVDILRALTRTETGRIVDGQFAPWPWTVNLEGQGRWFQTQNEAQSFAVAGHRAGSRSFDIGCFQINYKWHSSAFSSIDDMLDPNSNAKYAAEFLKSLHKETGSWSEAVAIYHSRTPEFAARYKSRFDRIMANLTPHSGDLKIAQTSTQPMLINRYPYLIPNQNTVQRLGSLVPVRAATSRALWTRKGALW